jgi:phosphatidylglycerophosphate synthase
MDGNFARTYNMMSEYGAMYDSISDIVVGLTLVYLFVKNKHIKKEFNFFKPLVIFLGIVLYGASMYYLSCQDTYYKENTKDKQLSYSYSGICYKTDHLSFVKYFGVGTLYLFIALTIASHIFVTKNKSLLYRY